MTTTTVNAWIMHILISTLLLVLGYCEAVCWQKLTCPYEQKHESLLRVWCRQSSAECCTGLAFSRDPPLVYRGKLKVTQDSHSFTVEVLEPGHTGGVHWCGVLSRNHTIIKLAEGYLHSSCGAFIWSFTRWILLPVLPVVTISISCVYSRASAKTPLSQPRNLCKKAEEPYEDVGVGGAPTAPQYENIVSSLELE